MGITNFTSKISLNLTFLVFGLVFSIYGFLVVESQEALRSPSDTPPPPPPPLMPESPPPSPHTIRHHLSPPPPHTAYHHPLPPQHTPNYHIHHHHPPPRRNRRHRPPPPPQNGGLNRGMTVGIVFAGFVTMLQICVAAFLVFKRKQLLKMRDTH